MTWGHKLHENILTKRHDSENSVSLFVLGSFVNTAPDLWLPTWISAVQQTAWHMISHMTWVLKQCLVVCRWRGNWQVWWSSSRTRKLEPCVGSDFVRETNLWVLAKYVEVIYVCLVCLSVFNQGEEGTSWYIIQKGSVNVVIYGKVCLWVFLNASIHSHASVSFHTGALLCFYASFDDISSVCNGLKHVACAYVEQSSSNMPCGWEIPAVESDKLCMTHHCV